MMKHAITAKAVLLGTLMAAGSTIAFADDHAEKPACYSELNATGQEVFDMVAEMRKTAMEDGEVTAEERQGMQDAMRSKMRSKVMSGELSRGDAQATGQAIQACLQAESS